MIRIKKLFIASSLMIAILGLSSCSKEDENLSTTELKTSSVKVVGKVEMQNFKFALIEMANLRNNKTDLKADNYLLTEEKQDVVYEAAKSLLLSTGLTETDFSNKVGLGKTAVIGMAMNIYAENNSLTTN